MANTNDNQTKVELPNLSDIVRRNIGAIPQQVQNPQIATTESTAEEVKQSEVTPLTAKVPPNKKASKGSCTKTVHQSSEHFTFICDSIIVEKIKAIASREGFTIRQVMGLFLNNSIDAYERKHGTAFPSNKDIKDLL